MSADTLRPQLTVECPDGCHHDAYPTVPAPPHDRVAAWRRLSAEARAAAEREHAAWAALTPAEREAETRLSVRRAT